MLWIFGAGGVGKSAMSFHLARAAFLGNQKSPLPILVDEDWDGTLSEHVARLLRPADSHRLPTAKMVQRLGSLGQLCPIVDSLSERAANDAVTRVGEAIANGDFKYVIINSREQPPIGQTWEMVHVLEARSLGLDDIPAFVVSYVDEVSARGTIEKKVRRLLLGTSVMRSPSALFLRFALEQMMEEEDTSSRNMDLVLRYIEAARKGKVDIAAEDFQRAACVAAVEALRHENERLAPAEIVHDRFIGSLNAAADKAPFSDDSREGVVTPSKVIEYLESCGVLHRNQLKQHLQFAYDPVAEYLTAWTIDQAPKEYAMQLRGRIDAHPDSGLARALQELRSPEMGEPAVV